MDTEAILAAIRRLLSDNGAATYSDLALLEALGDAVRELAVMGLTNMQAYVVDDTVNFDTTEAITPTPTLSDGQVMVYAVAVDLLNELLTFKLATGQLGTAWKSGLESETSNTQAKEFRAAISALQTRMDQAILVAIGSRSSARMM